MEKYLRETKMLDYSSKNIQQLIRERNWNDIEEFERLKSIYTFVRDEILFGYNIDDSVCASKVLTDGYGQCNTKGTLIRLEILEFQFVNLFWEGRIRIEKFGLSSYRL